MEKRDSSAFAEIARAKKVIAILGVIPTGRSQVENDLITLFLESLSEDQRQTYEILAGVKKCSDATWEMVRAAVRARHVPGDGGAIDRQQNIHRPDFSHIARGQFHVGHPREREGCVACARLVDEMNAAFDAGVTAAVRAVGL